jgi:hypothetical protein
MARLSRPALAWAAFLLGASSATAVVALAAPRRGPFGPSIPSQKGSTPPGTQAGELLDQLQGWERWGTFTPEPQYSKEHGGVYVTVHHDDSAGLAARNHFLPLPDGATLVAANRLEDDLQSPPVLMVMRKTQGRWFWLQTSNGQVDLDARGRPLAGWGSGATGACRSCHRKAAGNDFVFSHRFR